MVTSLANQLKKLAGPETSSFERLGLKKASLLFDPSEAAKYDFCDIYGIGLGGLQELQLLNPVFGNFESTLFSEVSQSIERSVQNTELNKKLDAQISEFLKLVSPYILVRPAIKALEWLIVRFHIHQYNLDDILLAFFPYHETNIFVRMVQLLEFRTNNKWEWLRGVQKKGVPLMKIDLLNFIGRHLWLVGFLCDATVGSVEKRKSGKEFAQSNDVYLKFFASTVILYLHTTPDIDNGVISVLLPCASKCLQSPDLDYRATGYSVLTSIASLTKLTVNTIRALTLAISKSATQFSDEAGIKALSVVCSSCNNEDIRGSVLEMFMDANARAFALKCMEKHSMDQLYWLILKSFLDGLFQKNNDIYADLSLLFLENERLSNTIKERILNYLVGQTLKKKSVVTRVDLSLGKVLARLRDMDPVSWCNVLNSDGRKNDRLLEKLDMTFSECSDAIYRESEGSKSSNFNTGIFLRLNHPNPIMRIVATSELMVGGESSFGKEFLKEMILARLKDRDPEIVQKILESPDVLRTVFEDNLNAIMRNLLLELYSSKKPQPSVFDVEIAALKVLISVTSHKEEIIPFFLMAILRKNQRLSELEDLVKLFPGTMTKNTAQLSAQELHEVISTDFGSFDPNFTFSVIGFLGILWSTTPNMPFLPVFWTLHNVIRNVGAQQLFFRFQDSIVILKVLQNFLSSLHITGADISEDPLQKSMRLLKRGKFSATFLIQWFSNLWNCDKATAPKALFHTAVFIFRDFPKLTSDKMLQLSLIHLFVSRVLKKNSVIQILLTSLANEPVLPIGLSRNVLRLTATAIKMAQTESTANETAGKIIVALLPFCGMEDSCIRQSAVNNFVQWQAHHMFECKEVRKFVEVVTENKSQIEIDSSASNKVVADAFFKPNISPKIQNFWLDLLLKPITEPAILDLSSVRLLMSTRSMMPGRVVSRLIQVAESVVSNYDSATSSDVQILNEFFERGVILLSKSEHSLDPDDQEVVFKLVLKGLRLKRVGNGESPADVIIRQLFLLSREQVGADRFDQLLRELIIVYLDKCNPLSRQISHRFLKHVRVPSSIIIHLLRESPQDVPNNKRLSHGLARLNNSKLQIVEFWERAASVLEIIQVKKKIVDIQSLIKELFELAKDSVVVDNKPELVEAVEKVRQIIFSSLNFHCRRLGGEGLDESIIDVPAIVECIRCSTDNHTYLGALVLLSTLAELIPANVVQNCITIFTLTGSKLMMKEDQYSAEVIGRTLDCIVPVMMKSDPANQHSAIRNVMELFVDALPHMPVQRRQFLFKRLLKVSDGSENLWILVVLLINIYVEKSLPIDESEPNKRKSYPILCEFLLQLFDEMPLHSVVENLVKATGVIFETALGTKTTTGTSKKLKSSVSFEKPLISSNFTIEENIRVISALLIFIPTLLASRVFQTSNSSSSADLDQSLEHLFAKLLSVQTRIDDQNKQKADWQELSAKASLAKSETLARMSWRSFVKVMLDVLNDSDAGSLKTSLEQLAGTLSFRAGFAKDDAASLIPLVKVLVTLAEKYGNKSAEHSAVRRGCLFCLKELAGSLGKDLSDSWIEVTNVSLKCLDAADISIQSEALNVLTVVIASLKAALLPRLPQILPKLLETIWDILLQDKQEAVAILAAITTTEVLMNSLAVFISPQLPTVLLILALCSVKHVKESVREIFSRKTEKIKSVICEGIVFRVFLSAFREASAILARKTDMPPSLQIPLFSIFNAGLKLAKTSDILTLQRDIIEMLFGIFDKKGENLGEAIKAFSTVAVRMPESLFKGLFMRLYQWMIQEQASKTRVVVFYQVANSLADTLKHLFTFFAPTTVSHAIITMNSLHIMKSPENVSQTSAADAALLVSVFSVLHKFFKYDATGYFNSDQCDILMQPLVDQLENFHDTESYNMILQPLIQAITAFVNCLTDDSLWKPLHYQVCLKTRSEEPEVRMGALKCIETLADSMGDSYSALFPEAVTFLVELSTDDNDKVEEQCLKTKETIERVMGDSNIWKDHID